MDNPLSLTTKADGPAIAGDPTPGPWKAEGAFVTADAERIPGVRVKKNIANTNVSSLGSEAEMFANAHLIAAAPDLYAALERYMAAYPAFRIKPEGAPGSPKRIEQENLMALEDAARAALRLARGEQS